MLVSRALPLNVKISCNISPYQTSYVLNTQVFLRPRTRQRMIFTRRGRVPCYSKKRKSCTGTSYHVRNQTVIKHVGVHKPFHRQQPKTHLHPLPRPLHTSTPTLNQRTWTNFKFISFTCDFKTTKSWMPWILLHEHNEIEFQIFGLYQRFRMSSHFIFDSDAKILKMFKIVCNKVQINSNTFTNKKRIWFRKNSKLIS